MKWRKYWHDPVWSKVIASVLIATFAILYTGIRYCWDNVPLMQILRSMTQVNTIFLFILTMIFLYLLYKFVQNLLRNSTIANNQSLKYTKDSFRGLKWSWEWEYDIDKYVLVNLKPYCPKCSTKMIYYEGGPYGMGGQNARCPQCSHSIHEYNGCPLGQDIRALIDNKMEQREEG